MSNLTEQTKPEKSSNFDLLKLFIFTISINIRCLESGEYLDVNQSHLLAIMADDAILIPIGQTLSEVVNSFRRSKFILRSEFFSMAS